ncbi:MAG: hypothetical protein ACRECA_01145 [Pseudolabrys sp.]
MQHTTNRSIAAALAGAIALSTIAFAPAQAASNTATTFSARRHWHHHGNAAMIGAVAGVFGTIAAIAAADQYRNDYYGYDGGPYYAPYGYYYGGPRYYGGGHWRHHHHWR